MKAWNRRPLVVLVLGLVLGIIPETEAKWFILPGVYYDWDFGLVGNCTFIAEGERKNRLLVQAEYFGENGGQIRGEYFLPTRVREWTFGARYQAAERRAFSPYYASNQEECLTAKRRWTEFLVRCDLPVDNGLFYGVQGSYRKYSFDDETVLLGGAALSPPIMQATFMVGEEYLFSLRVGLERRNDRYHTKKGTYLLWQCDLGEANASSERFQLVRLSVDGRQYIELLPKSTLALNLRTGIAHHELPYFSRFKLGGSQSLRGFPLERYSGNGFYLLRAEFRQEVKSNLKTPLYWLKKIMPELPDPRFTAGFVVFTDCGDLWRDDLGWWSFRQGIGVGLRAVFPPSVVAAIDIAKPVDSASYAIYLDLQQSF
ncbi:MAG: BamA/TamA family outer membrane protein [bacterium]